MSEVREVCTSEIAREKKMKMKVYCLFSLLNEDLIIDEILLKLPVKSLLSLRCVSRYFHSLITNPSFIKKHLLHDSTTPLLLITCRFTRCVSNPNTANQRYQSYTFQELFQHFSCNFNVVDDPSLPEVLDVPCPFELVGEQGSSVGIYGSCNGLVFLYRDNKKLSYIWNPCTKEYIEYSNPSIMRTHEQRISSDFCGFGYDGIKDEYKVLYHEKRVGCLTENELSRLGTRMFFSEFKLYTVGSGTWKSISHSPYESLFSGYPWRKSIGLLVNGALHWIVSSKSSSGFARTAMLTATNARIISFHVEMEKFQEVQKPHCSTSSLGMENYYAELQVLQECLCLCQFPNSRSMGTFDIWMLKDYTMKDSWTKLFRVEIPEDLLPSGLFAIKKLRLVRFCENGEIIMLIRDHKNHLIVYDPVNHRRSRLVENVDETTQNKWEHAVYYRESLVSLNSGNKEWTTQVDETPVAYLHELKATTNRSLKTLAIGQSLTAHFQSGSCMSSNSVITIMSSLFAAVVTRVIFIE